MDKLLEPLVAIVLLCVMLKLPLTLARVAMLGGQALSGGFVSRAVSYAAGRSMTNAAGAAPARLARGGRGDRTERHAAARATARAGRGGRLRNAAAWPAPPQPARRAAGASAAAGGGRPARRPPARQRRARGRPPGAPRTDGAYTPPPTAQAHGCRTSGCRTGCSRRASHGREQDFANEHSRPSSRARTEPGVARAGPRGAAQPARRHAARRRRGSSRRTAPGRASISPTRRMGEWTAGRARSAAHARRRQSRRARRRPSTTCSATARQDDPPVPMAESAPGQTAVHEQSGGGTIDAGPEPRPRPAEPHDVGADGANAARHASSRRRRRSSPEPPPAARAAERRAA